MVVVLRTAQEQTRPVAITSWEVCAKSTHLTLKYLTIKTHTWNQNYTVACAPGRSERWKVIETTSGMTICDELRGHCCSQRLQIPWWCKIKWQVDDSIVTLILDVYPRAPASPPSLSLSSPLKYSHCPRFFLPSPMLTPARCWLFLALTTPTPTPSTLSLSAQAKFDEDIVYLGHQRCWRAHNGPGPRSMKS